MDLSIHDVMNDLVRADAARMSGRDFADARGPGVARRVRTRRTVRAAGIGGGTMLTAGALVVGALNLPWGATSTDPGATGASGCVEAPWPRVGPDGSIGSGSFLGLDLLVNLTLDGLTLSERDTDPRSEVTVPVNGRLLQGTSRQDEPLALTMPSGNDVTVSLRWTDAEIAASAGDGSGEMISFFSIQRFPSEEAEAYPVRYHEIDEVGLPSTNPFPTWILWDDYANAAALAVTLEDQQTFHVQLPDGSEQSFPLGSDGLATFTWRGMTFDSQAVTADEKNFGIRMSVDMVTADEVTAPLDATLSGPEFCIPDGRAVPNASAEPSAATAPEPSESATAIPTPTPVNHVITSLPYTTDSDVWLTSGGESVALFFWQQPSDGLVTLRASESGDILPRLAEYTVAIVDGVARVSVGDVVARVRVDSGGPVTVESVEPVGAQASKGAPTSGVVDPWFSLGVADTIDLDAVIGG